MGGDFSAISYRDIALQDNDTNPFEQARRDAALDEALRCTFPASDPVALNFAFVSLVMTDREQQRVKTDPVR